ncbi:MAG TPA: helix-turn-helix domain-containing protein [Solirubrobacteraceae bacterium]|jgi:transcriptional regulator with XRE-family HTH domain|nr:helix-turn-helix domain-containing protein [Solirubrobacteraceae bacterium]
MTQPGLLIRERRLPHGLTQAQLALRAGTTQTALNRLERDEISPRVATVERILFVLGEALQLDVKGLEGDFDAAHLAALVARPPAERLELAMSWNKLAGEVALAGRRAREAP